MSRNTVASYGLTNPDMSWQNRAACARSRIDMFPTTTDGIDAAKALCALCPVVGPCQDYAMANDIADGVWGGLSETDRRRIKRELKAMRGTA